MIAGSRLVALVLVALTAAAHAQNAKAADEAFRQGRDFIKAGKWAEACEQFDKSQRLDPQLGTLFNIGQCSEHINRLATAIAAYREVVERDTKEERKTVAKERLAALEPRVSKLVVQIDNPPSGVSIALDSRIGPRDIPANKPVEVDFGDYTIVVRARGHSEFISKVKIYEEKKTTTIEATLTAGASNSETVEAGESPGGTRKLVAIGAMATGGAAVVTGVVFGVLAQSAWNEAKEVCGGGTSCTSQADVDAANAAAAPARTRATISTIFVIGGAVIGGVGAYLWFTMPREVQVAPAVTDTGASVTIRGRF